MFVLALTFLSFYVTLLCAFMMISMASLGRGNCCMVPLYSYVYVYTIKSVLGLKVSNNSTRTVKKCQVILIFLLFKHIILVFFLSKHMLEQRENQYMLEQKENQYNLTFCKISSAI